MQKAVEGRGNRPRKPLGGEGTDHAKSVWDEGDGPQKMCLREAFEGKGDRQHRNYLRGGGRGM